MAVKRANLDQIAEDRNSLAALAKIAGYAPHKPERSVAALKAQESAMDAKAVRVAELRAELAGAIDDYHAEATSFSHNVSEARDEVGLQFGRDSNEVQSVGRTKTSERKPPVRKPKPNA
jgi:hypothetical protein